MRINVLGLGESISSYKPDGNVSIGVNDIYKHHKTDYLCVVDLPERFTKERFRTILNSRPKKFFTHLENWQPLMRGFEKIKLDKYRGCLDGLEEKEIVSHSNNSAFVATVLAYKMGAKEIVLYGVDFTNHSHLGVGRTLDRALQDFENLYKRLENKGVSLYICDSRSALNRFIPIKKIEP